MPQILYARFFLTVLFSLPAQGVIKKGPVTAFISSFIGRFLSGYMKQAATVNGENSTADIEKDDQH
ncbi:hypothetical protein A9Q99_19320 [Gammaproteobacteria bacterium 45_16_T64]|nr:hypothetical protein A9Q99_19320 [Gammaproteobacteria bacterium 45_16_T64]